MATPPNHIAAALALLCACGVTEPPSPAEPVEALPARSEAFAAGPGAPPYDDALIAELDEARRALPEDYAPHTRHLTEAGAPRFTNRLLLSSSPYLRQHAHNPVDWHPWGDDAFELAGWGAPCC